MFLGKLLVCIVRFETDTHIFHPNLVSFVFHTVLFHSLFEAGLSLFLTTPVLSAKIHIRIEQLTGFHLCVTRELAVALNKLRYRISLYKNFENSSLFPVEAYG